MTSLIPLCLAVLVIPQARLLRWCSSHCTGTARRERSADMVSNTSLSLSLSPAFRFISEIDDLLLFRLLGGQLWKLVVSLVPIAVAGFVACSRTR